MVLDERPLEAVRQLRDVGLDDVLARALVDDLLEAVPGSVIGVCTAVYEETLFIMSHFVEAVSNISFG